MTSDDTARVGSVEARHLSDGISLIRDELRDMRQEVRDGMNQRPTHSDLGSLKLLNEKQLELVIQQLNQNRERHDAQMAALSKEFEQLKVDMAATEQKADATEKDKKSLQRQLILGFLGTLGGLVATNWWQGMGPG